MRKPTLAHRATRNSLVSHGTHHLTRLHATAAEKGRGRDRAPAFAAGRVQEAGAQTQGRKELAGDGLVDDRATDPVRGESDQDITRESEEEDGDKGLAVSAEITCDSFAPIARHGKCAAWLMR
jgi:hypothetical protein